jgi:hypothetical protein
MDIASSREAALTITNQCLEMSLVLQLFVCKWRVLVPFHALREGEWSLLNLGVVLFDL